MESKGLVTGPSSAPSKKRRNKLLFFGLGTYDDWPRLEYPVSDCEALWKVLSEEYDFEEDNFITKPVFDKKATTENLFGEIYKLQDFDENGPYVGPDDNLILVFSGHGHWTHNEGYWVPIDAPQVRKPIDLKRLISVSEIIKILSNVKAHHILLIVDACFSESFAKMSVDYPADIQSNNPEDKPSRWVLTAGRLEKVPDKSVFSQKLIETLRQNKKPTLSISTLGSQVVDAVRESIGKSPLCVSIVEAKYNGGEFFFHRKKSSSPLPLTPSDKSSTLAQRLKEGSGQHRERLFKGRYRHLTIENILLTGFRVSDQTESDPLKLMQQFPLLEKIGKIWKDEKPYVVLFGEGGMGKTVSLLRIWDDLLKSDTTIPIFIPLHEYNSSSETDKEDFILRYIARHYLQTWELTAELKNELWALFTHEATSSPTLTLLLDGFNEITVRKDQLLLDLDLISTHSKGVQLIIASRYTDIQNFPWARHAQTMELLPLSEQSVISYLNQSNLDLPADPTLRKLFANPMMLTLYSGANNTARKYESDTRYQFLKVSTYGELLWNFNEAQLAQQVESSAHDTDDELYQVFLFRVLVPYLAYRMEAAGRYFITSHKSKDPAFNFKSLLEEAFDELNTEYLTEIFPEFAGKRTFLGLGKLDSLDGKEIRYIKVKQYLVEKLRLMVIEGDELRFQHQNFRDFFAVCHIQTSIRLALKQGAFPTTLSSHHLPIYLRRMLGEIEGEQYMAPAWDGQAKSWSMAEGQNLLAQLLETCRQQDFITESPLDSSRDFIVWNVLTIWLESRQTLAGANLSNLDLRRFTFNNKPLSIHYNGFYLAANFENSLLDGNRFIFNGHYGQINAACYNANATRIVSASDDKKVIEWDISTGELLKTYEQHTNKVSSVRYSPDQKKILSGSHDLTLIEWEIESEEFTIINTGHTNRINCAVYSPDGNTILSASGDSTLREFEVKTRKCVHTYTGHTKSVQHVTFNKSGDKFLSASADGTLKEWSISDKSCLRTLSGHTERVTWVEYSLDGKKALSSSDDHTIRIWDLENGGAPIVLEGHTDAVNCAVYSRDGKKILSASADKTVKEWSAQSGILLKNYEGHFDKVNTACYSPDESRILSAADDKSIREWSVQTGILLQEIEGQSNWASRVSGSFHPKGTKFLTVNYDKTISEFSTTSGLCLQNLQGHTKWISGAWYSPVGSRILSASDDCTLREWSVMDGRCIRIYRGHTSGIKEAFYSPDGKKIFSLAFRDEYKEWAAKTGECLHTLVDSSANRIFDENKKTNSNSQTLEFVIKTRNETIMINKTEGGTLRTIQNQTGLLVQGCDFRGIHPSSAVSDTIKDMLRTYGAIFSEEDALRWREAVREGYAN